MQESNKSKTAKPLPGDGTLEQKKTQDANWFGTSQEPQEEFIESTEGGRSGDSEGDSRSTAKSSIKPTMSGDNFGIDGLKHSK